MKKRGSTKLERLWKEILSHSHKYRTREPIEVNGRVVAFKIEVHERYPEPSLRSQLYERGDLMEAERVKAYLQSCQLEPYASNDTKKKWKRAVQLD